MTGSLSDHGWEIVNSFALGRQHREKPIEGAPSVDSECHADEAPNQEMVTRLTQSAEVLSEIDEMTLESEPEEETDA